MTEKSSYLVYAGRTAIGKFQGCFAQTPAPQLGASLVRDAVRQTQLDPAHFDEIVMGQVLTAGVGQAPARQTALLAGLPHSVCATTVNRVCGSGLKAVMLADQALRLGEARLILAGGQENMTLAPHLLPQSRVGYRFGAVELKDHMQWDGLWDPYDQVPMGHCGELCAREYHFSREQQDAFALQSYQRAQQAQAKGLFRAEIVPVSVRVGKNTLDIAADEEPGSVDLARLASLRPAFAADGTVTAGNASSINDGAALVVLASAQALQQEGLKPLARIVAQASHAQAPSWFTTAPIVCIRKVLAKAQLNLSDIDLFEINEAFAVVTMAAIHELGLDPEKVNVHGGAVALGHPIGASGTRVLVSLVHALRARGAKRGLATLCIGGGEASAVIVEVA